MDWVEIAVLLLHLGAVLVLCALGAHRLWLLRILRRCPPRPAPAGLPEPPPRVTVQLPIYNERNVLARLVRAVGALDYPHERLEVQLLDDSTDSTSRLAAAGCRWLRARGVEAAHIRRADRSGYKAGALAGGLRRARGELVAIFDADFVPPSDFLRRTVPAFRDPEVGMVQACWGHLNRGESLLTRLQALLLDGHFLLEQAARERSGRFFNFNGTCGVWRRACIEEAGGWTADTLTEDMDLSYRAQLAGWRFRFLPEAVVPGELPARMNAFKGQQRRWAEGSIQTCRKLLPRILRSPHRLRVKAEALFHLTANLAYPVVLLLAILLLPSHVIRHEHRLPYLSWLDLPIFLLTAGAVGLFYGTAACAAGRRKGRLGLIFPIMGLGTGISLGQSLAVLRGAQRRGGAFRRTPKTGGRGGPPRYVARPSALLLGELALAGYLTWALAQALGRCLWPAVPFLALFCWGFLYAGISSLREALLPDR